MSEDWRDYDRHFMVQGTTRNTTFHHDPECRKIKHPEKVVDRADSFLAFHDPTPCEVCHEHIQKTRNTTPPNKYTSMLAGGGD